ncbi:hypothetical protein TWF694_001125 [Orbilia ellipsospora]|uniref:DNA polymerase epsilon subunit D n=1 Tax=Orbilia ellipsospora TaxID=2528407 RepID=A0AAV9XQR3_9PEZI
MPPKKSDANKAAAAAAAAVVPASDPAGSDQQSEGEKPKGKRSRSSIDDNTLPKTIVTRLAKGNIPSNTSISKDAVTAFTRSSTLFINYLASAANDITKGNGKKTIVPNDIIDALDVIEFPGMKERLQGELKKFNEKQELKKAKVKGSKAADTTADTTIDPMSEDDSARPLKRQRKSLANESKDDEEDAPAAPDESNILEEGSEEEEGAGYEEEEGEEGEEEESTEDEEESGEEEAADGMEDTVEDLDRGDDMENDNDNELDEESD